MKSRLKTRQERLKSASFKVKKIKDSLKGSSLRNIEKCRNIQMGNLHRPKHFPCNENVKNARTETKITKSLTVLRNPKFRTIKIEKAFLKIGKREYGK